MAKRTETWYEFDKPPKNVKVRTKSNDDYLAGLKYFIYAGKEIYKTEDGWLQADRCDGLGLLSGRDYLEERVAW